MKGSASNPADHSEMVAACRNLRMTTVIGGCPLAAARAALAILRHGGTPCPCALRNCLPRRPLLALRQRPGDDVVADRGLHEVVPAGHDGDVLPAVDFVGDREIGRAHV